jgi:hypothetical protein
MRVTGIKEATLGMAHVVTSHPLSYSMHASHVDGEQVPQHQLIFLL